MVVFEFLEGVEQAFCILLGKATQMRLALFQQSAAL
jgi:hypothetical protein